MDNNKKPDVSFVWKITDDVLRDTFKKNEIGDVILPFVVIRRIDCILKPYNETVRKNYEQFKDKIADQNANIHKNTPNGLPPIGSVFVV